MFLIENSLYTTQTEYDDFIKDKEQVANALLFNFFGFISLFAAAPRKDVKMWKTIEKQVRLDNIGDENTDVSISVKMASDAGMIPRSTADKFTKLLSLFKQGKIVKNSDIDDDLILDLFKLAKFDTVNKPSSQLRSAVQSYLDRDINIAFLAKEIYKFARIPAIAKVNQEFFRMYKSGMYLQVYSALLTGLSGLKMGVPQHLVKTITNKTIIHKKAIDPTGITQVVDAIEDIKDDFQEPGAKKQPPEIKNLNKLEKQVKKTTVEVEPNVANVQELPQHVVEPEPEPEPELEPEFDPFNDPSDVEFKMVKPNKEYINIVGYGNYRDTDKLYNELKDKNVQFGDALESEDAFIKLFLTMFGNQSKDGRSPSPIMDVNAYYKLFHNYALREKVTLPEWIVPRSEMLSIYDFCKYKKDDGLYQSLVLIKTSYNMLNRSCKEVVNSFDRFSGIKSIIGGSKKTYDQTVNRFKKYGAKINVSEVMQNIKLDGSIAELIRELFMTTSLLRVMYGEGVKVDSRFNFLLNLVEYEVTAVESSRSKKFIDNSIADFNPRPATIDWLRENLTPLDNIDYFIYNDGSASALRFVSVSTQVNKDVESVLGGRTGYGKKLTFHSNLPSLFGVIRLFYTDSVIRSIPRRIFERYGAEYIAQCAIDEHNAGGVINNLAGAMHNLNVKEVLMAICSDLADHGYASKMCKGVEGMLSKILITVGTEIEDAIGTEKYQKLLNNKFAVNGMGEAHFFFESNDNYIKENAELYRDNIFIVQSNVEIELAEQQTKYNEAVDSNNTSLANDLARYINGLVGVVKSHYIAIIDNTTVNDTVDSSYVDKYIIKNLTTNNTVPPSVMKVIFDEYTRDGRQDEIRDYIKSIRISDLATQRGSGELIAAYPEIVDDLSIGMAGDYISIGHNSVRHNPIVDEFVSAYFKVMVKDPKLVKLNSEGLLDSFDDVDHILLTNAIKMNVSVSDIASPLLIEQIKQDVTNIKPNDIAKRIVDLYNNEGDDSNANMLGKIQVICAKPHLFSDDIVEAVMDIPYGGGQSDSASKLGSKLKEGIASKMYNELSISEIGERSPKVKGAILGSRAINSFDDIAAKNVDMIKSIIESSAFDSHSDIPSDDVLLKIAKINGIGMSGFNSIDLSGYDSKEAFEQDYDAVLEKSFLSDIVNEYVMPTTETIVDEKSLHEESLKLHNTSNGRHGDTAPIIKKRYVINMDRSKLEAFVERDKQNPNSTSKGTVDTYMFHGTGSIATAFITKFGFRELPQNLGLFVTGKMLGEGIYLAKNIDKSLSYIGDDGFNKSYRKGYVFVVDACIGEKYVDYRDDEGGTLSQEWCIKNFEHQMVITDIYEVESVPRYDFKRYDIEQKAKRDQEKEGNSND